MLNIIDIVCVCMCIYIYIYMHVCVCMCIYMGVQNVLSITHTWDLLYTSHFCMSFTRIEIKTEIWISFPNFIRSSSVLPQLFLWEVENFLNKHCVCVCVYFSKVVDNWLHRGVLECLKRDCNIGSNEKPLHSHICLSVDLAKYFLWRNSGTEFREQKVTSVCDFPLGVGYHKKFIHCNCVYIHLYMCVCV